MLPIAGKKANYRFQGAPESMPKNPLMMNEGLKAMQKGLMGAKKNKPMKNPMKRPKTAADSQKAM